MLTTPALGATRQIFLWYPDGGPPPPSVRKICQGTPPAFQCRSGTDVDQCRRLTQELLDRWYADFDVVFSYAEPPTGAFDTVVVASEGAWCGADPRTASRSFLPACTDAPGGAVAIFHCGDDAKLCATLIAKEQAHLVGLQHTGSLMDVMNETTSLEHAGFEDAENLSSAIRCGRFQNSYRLMLERLGAWPGGPKPPPAPPNPRAEPPPVDAATPADDAASPPEDAAAPPDDGPVVANDASDATASPDAAGDEGCACALARPWSGQRGGQALTLLVLAVLGARAASRRRRSPTL